MGIVRIHAANITKEEQRKRIEAATVKFMKEVRKYECETIRPSSESPESN